MQCRPFMLQMRLPGQVFNVDKKQFLDQKIIVPASLSEELCWLMDRQNYGRKWWPCNQA